MSSTHIKDFSFKLFDGDKGTMQKVYRTTVVVLQLKAPRVSTIDAKIVCGQLLSGETFSNFNEEERMKIWGKLSVIDGC